jgi:biotin synthase
MPDINIAAATALEILDPRGRELGLLSGANVIMPNITPQEQMVKYNLYDRKTLNASDVKDLEAKKIPIGYGQWGDLKRIS